jgi:hypothetical protein
MMSNHKYSKWQYMLVIVGLLLLTVAGLQSTRATEAVEATLYKNPGCQCCDDYAAYLRQHDFNVTVVESPDLEQFKREQAIPLNLQSCHTMLVDGYAVEGHVPVTVIEKLLHEQPEIRGVSLPGMPSGSPGMTGQKQEPFEIYTIMNGEASVYATL